MFAVLLSLRMVRHPLYHSNESIIMHHFTSRSPFESKREGVLRLAIINGRYNYPPSMRMRDCTYSSAFKDLVDSMLRHNMKDRPQCADIVTRLEGLLTR